jgi:hypothetical protein
LCSFVFIYGSKFLLACGHSLAAQQDEWRSIDGRASRRCSTDAPEKPALTVRERAVDGWVSALRCVDAAAAGRT